MKLLVKKKDGKVHIREKSQESAENLDAVAPTKAATWEAFGRASYESLGKTMEDVNRAIANEMTGVIFRDKKERREVTQEEYESLAIQCLKKDVSLQKLNNLVVVRKKEVTEKDIQKMVEQFIKGE